MKLKSDPSKDEEIKHYKKFIADLPKDSYLYMMLKETPHIIEREIKSDFALPLVSSEEVESLKATIKRYEDETKDYRSKKMLFDYIIRELQRRHRRHLRKFKTIAKRIKNNNNYLQQANNELRELNKELRNKYSEVQSLHEYLNN